jgi:protein-L-isoaspartate(D-aspartate) O-methyltransferase
MLSDKDPTTARTTRKSASRPASVAEVRAFYAKEMASASGSSDPRIEQTFKSVRREAFMPPGPWRVLVGDNYVKTPSADPRYLYQNNLIALDASQGINNGEPFLHARWIGAVAPKPGEAVTHIGAGTGYYSAVLSMLVLPNGILTAYEVDERLAAQARLNLAQFENVTVVLGNAVSVPVPKSDLIYVNAGVVAPPGHWLDALRPGARMIFPWRPTAQTALAALITHTEAGFEFKPLMPAWFIPCLGASETSATDILPDKTGAWKTRSVHLKRYRAPDESATAIYEDVWFSLESLAP